MVVFVNMKGMAVIMVVVLTTMAMIVVVMTASRFPDAAYATATMVRHQPRPNDGDKGRAQRFKPSLGSIGFGGRSHEAAM